MYHLRRIKVLLAACLLASASLWAQDTKLKISSAVASSYHDDNHAAANAIDGDASTIWHTNWSSIPDFPVTFTITLEEVSHVDYVRYVSRPSGSINGNWKEVTVLYCATTNGTDFVEIGTFDLGGSNGAHDLYLGEAGVTCGQIRFSISPGATDSNKKLASAAEIEVHDNMKFGQYFTDDLYTVLRSDVTSSEGIVGDNVKALVENLLGETGNSYKKFRVGEYEPYMTTATLQSNLKLSSQYNNYENPTGIYLEKGQSCYVAVSGIGNYPVGLKIKDWYLSKDESSYPLRNGLNYITATTEGNVFVNYYTDDFENAPNVKVHFINAPVLGYWDSETMENADWEEMLAGPLAKDDRIIITRSEHAQLAYPIGQWKLHNPTDIKTTMEFYQQVQWAERDMLGLEQYGRQVKNRQLFYGDTSRSMAAGGDAAWCGYESLEVLMTPDSKRFDFWGVGHEWGHNNQMTPGFKWTGCGETTNNIPASWAQFHFTGNRDANGNPTYLRLEDENSGIDEYAGMRGGRMQVYFEEGLRKGVAWQLQDGADYHGASLDIGEVDEYDADGNATGNKVPKNSRNYDHFVKLSPFWQLNLWGTLADKCSDIIPMVIESIRTTEDYATTYNTNGKQQINWMKLACDVTQINLLPFFEKAGMLRPIHAYIEDYDAGWNIITEEMIDKLKAYVEEQGYPAFTEEINYINGHNYRIYRDTLKLVVPETLGTGCTLNGHFVTVQHSDVQHAVAFETYNSADELIRITMYGLGSNDAHSYTQVLFPESFVESEAGAYIKAVGYDGERKVIYQRYSTEDESKEGYLSRLLEDVEAIFELEDVSKTKAGFYKESALTNLHAAYDKAKAVYDENVTAEFSAVYDLLFHEYTTLLNDDYALIDVKAGYAYRLQNKYTSDRYMAVNDANAVIGLTLDEADRKQQWIFEAADEEDVYYIKNASTGTYLGDLVNDVQISATADKNDAKGYKAISLGDGLWALQCQNDEAKSLNYNRNNGEVLGWTHNGDAGSHWYLIATSLDDNVELIYALQDLIAQTELLVAEVKDNSDAYASISAKLEAAQTQLATAKEQLEAGNSEGYDILNEKYNELLEAKKTADKTLLSNTLSSLSTLIAKTKTLIAECGSVRPTTSAALTLTTTAGDANNYLTGGPSGSSEGSLEELYDNKASTFYVSNWSAQTSAPYLQVQLPDGEELSEFTFTFTSRNSGNAPTPTRIVVSGSNDGSLFTEIMTFTDAEHDFPEPANGGSNKAVQWTSPTIEASTAYKYLRFTVTESDRSSGSEADDNGFYHFGISEFGLSTVDGYSIAWTGKEGDATKELLLAAYKEMKAAESSLAIATTEAQLQKAIDRLQADYDALSDAKNTVKYVDYTISANVDGGGVVYGGENYTTDLTAPSTVTFTVEDAIALDGYVAKRVTIDVTTITVIYNKVYTVQVVGGEGNGRVTYAGTEYENNDTFDAEQDSFTADDLTVLDVEGYNAALAVDHEAGIISVVYTLDKSAFETLKADVETLIASCYTDGVLNYVNSAYVNETSMTEINDAVAATQTQCGNATTLEEYNAALSALQSAKETLSANIASAITEATERESARENLRTLIAKTEELIGECGVIAVSPATTMEGNVALQTKYPEEAFYLSTNAQESTEGDISGLTDDDKSTFFHSSWKARIGEPHYLQVDMGGEQYALKEFAFAYTTRDNDTGGPHPSVIVVSGSNSLDEKFENLVIIESGLPTAGNTSWSTTENVVVPKMPYRYLRFTVTQSSGANGCKHSSPDEYFFAMSKFSLTAIPAEATYYVKSLNPNGSVTEEQLLVVFNAKMAAAELANISYDKTALEEKTASLQTLYDDLQAAYDTKQVPVTLTTDHENPVLYTIKSKRGDAKAVQYEPASSHLFSIAEASDGSAKQAFYFMVGDERTQVYVYPYAAGQQVLAADNTGDGAAKVFAKQLGNATYEQWKFVERTVTKEETDGTTSTSIWYNLQPVGTSTYLSNIYVTSYKLGFYATDPGGDPGSLFQFESTTVEGSGAYNSLKVYYDEATKVKSSEIVGGEGVGYYPTDAAEAYNAAYDAATTLVADNTSAYDACLTAYNTLLEANEALAINMPEEDKYYTIASACSDHRGGQLMYATGENAIVFSREMTNVKPEALWKFTAEGYLENLQTGCSVSTASTGGEHHKLGESPRVITVKSISADGQVLLTPEGADPLHAQDNGSVVVGYGDYEAGTASAWRIVEVEDMSLVNFALKIGQYRHAGLYLNYAAEIPEDIEVYIAHTPDGEEGSIFADKLEGSILPARTAVIVKGDEGEYTFKYTTDENTTDADRIADNLLGGSAYLKYQQVVESGNLCCVFGQKGGEVGLYKNWVGYIDVNGTAAEDTNGDGKVNEDGGTHFKVSANKIYYEYEPSAVAGASAFRFRFNSNDEETTTIDNLMITEDAVIYNLYGQRIMKIAEPGIYIVNGKKTYVSDKMILNND